MFLGKGVLKTCSKFIRKHPCRSAISIKWQSNFIKITLWHGCSSVNLLHISIKWQCNFIKITLRHGCSSVNLLHTFRTLFSKNTSGGLLLSAALNQRTKTSLNVFLDRLAKIQAFILINMLL